jgi:3-oxoacyl-[acyl-carrier protein] reductase
MASLSFKDRVALVTGASTGIGAATAIRLSECGVKVVVNYFRSKSEAEKVAASIKSHGGSALLVQADVRDAVQVEKMVASTLTEFGRVDILVNNAGGLPKRVPVLQMDDALWNELMDLNLRSAFYCSKAVVPHMIERRYGRIVNLSSVAAFTGGAKDSTVYAAAKAGVNAFTKGLAKELAPYGITVNSVAPGFIKTAFHVKAQTGSFDQYIPSIPLKRVGTAEEVASIIAYLASDESSYVTGSVFHVDGGQYLA